MSSISAGFDAVDSAGFSAGTHEYVGRRRESQQSLTYRIRGQTQDQRKAGPPAPSAGTGAVELSRCFVSRRTDSMTR